MIPEPQHPLPITPAELTERQREVVALVARGWTDKRIATELGLKYNTVRIYIAAAAYRLGLTDGGTHTRVMIAKWFLEREQRAA